MGQVLLVRHGQASWGAADYDVLSDTGEEQSRELGRFFADRGLVPDLLLSGAMMRHRETARLCAETAGWAGEITVDDGWNEFDHLAMLGAMPDPFEGREPTREEFQVWFEEASRRWTGGEHDLDYSESFADFGARVRGAIGRTVERLGDGGSAVVFTSGGPISALAAALLDHERVTHLFHRLSPVIANASVTKLVDGRRGTTLVSFNDHAHLDPERLTYR